MDTKSDAYQELAHSGKVWEDWFQPGDSERYGYTKLQQASKFHGETNQENKVHAPLLCEIDSWRQSMNLGTHVKTLITEYAHQSVTIENNKLELSMSRRIEDFLLKTIPQETNSLVSMSIRDLSGLLPLVPDADPRQVTELQNHIVVSH
ncbi:hypothetical protein DFH08DRAFT_790810 [Mycena albidolilacea]|uniref:Uncharacterized protein n=1 Tax=Mycena albidolilacea TaxID=1033008 RepID=A0AAD6ZAR0_9AGAR|nr:hypothetical protein DFH08DRAFT_790810 [Mycena albidolilacea]